MFLTDSSPEDFIDIMEFEKEKKVKIDYGQGIGAAPEAYFAGQSMERVRRGTAQSPVFCEAKNGPIII